MTRPSPADIHNQHTGGFGPLKKESVMKLQNCPMCGKQPKKMVFGAGWAQDGYTCCGHSTDTLKIWNQHAAATSLAKTWLSVIEGDEDDDVEIAKYKKYDDARRVTKMVFNA